MILSISLSSSKLNLFLPEIYQFECVNCIIYSGGLNNHGSIVDSNSLRQPGFASRQSPRQSPRRIYAIIIWNRRSSLSDTPFTGQASSLTNSSFVAAFELNWVQSVDLHFLVFASVTLSSLDLIFLFCNLYLVDGIIALCYSGTLVFLLDVRIFRLLVFLVDSVLNTLEPRNNATCGNQWMNERIYLSKTL